MIRILKEFQISTFLFLKSFEFPCEFRMQRKLWTSMTTTLLRNSTFSKSRTLFGKHQRGISRRDSSGWNSNLPGRSRRLPGSLDLGYAKKLCMQTATKEGASEKGLAARHQNTENQRQLSFHFRICGCIFSYEAKHKKCTNHEQYGGVEKSVQADCGP